MSLQSEFNAALESGDFNLASRIMAKIQPHMPAPQNEEQAEITMHLARTQAPTVSFAKRAYSHRWLIERMLPSQLPDELKPKAERMYPVIVDAVFVSVNTNSKLMKPVAEFVQGSMCDAVEECYADGRKEPVFVRGRMQEARKRTLKALLGTERVN